MSTRTHQVRVHVRSQVDEHVRAGRSSGATSSEWCPWSAAVRGGGLTGVMLDDAHLPSERETPVVDNSTNGAGHEMSGTRCVNAHPWWPAGKSGECTLWSPRLEGGELGRHGSKRPGSKGGAAGRWTASSSRSRVVQPRRCRARHAALLMPLVVVTRQRHAGPSSSRAIRRWTEGCARVVGGASEWWKTGVYSSGVGCPLGCVEQDQRHSGVVQVGAGDS
jgi:hypothetical protein